MTERTAPGTDWPLNLLVFGATGGTGRPLVSLALSRGHAVTAFARTPAKLAMTHKRLRVAAGDVTDAEAVARAVPGHDAVCCALGAPSPFHRFPGLVDGVRHIVQAMEAARVRRLVYLSMLVGTEAASGLSVVGRRVMPLVLRHPIADHAEKEAIVRASALDWVIVRPARLTNGPRTGRYRSGVEP